jgi:hypothetical protein
MPTTINSVRASGVPVDDANLRAEADYLHRILFGAGAPDEVKRQYAAALAANPISRGGDIASLIGAGVDLEAVEYALRKKNPANPLTDRFRVLCYLVEARPEYLARFVAERRRFVPGVLALAFHSVRSILKAIQGRFLVRRHGLG